MIRNRIRGAWLVLFGKAGWSPWQPEQPKSVEGLLTANYVALKRLNEAIERYEDLEASRIFGVDHKRHR